MFNWRQKEPEKPKPNFQGDQHEHKSCLVVFDGTKAVDKLHEFKDQYNKVSIVKDKTTIRLKSMIESCEQISTHYVRLQSGCINSIQIAKTYEEMMAMRLGLVPVGEIQGIAICPGCLQQTIFACEEVLKSLNDIQIATKEYT